QHKKRNKEMKLYCTKIAPIALLVLMLALVAHSAAASQTKESCGSASQVVAGPVTATWPPGSTPQATCKSDTLTGGFRCESPGSANCGDVCNISTSQGTLQKRKAICVSSPFCTPTKACTPTCQFNFALYACAPDGSEEVTLDVTCIDACD